MENQMLHLTQIKKKKKKQNFFKTLKNTKYNKPIVSTNQLYTYFQQEL